MSSNLECVELKEKTITYRQNKQPNIQKLVRENYIAVLKTFFNKTYYLMGIAALFSVPKSVGKKLKSPMAERQYFAVK